jgi:hypothetical protein
VRTLAARRGRDLDAEGVAVVAMGGAKNVRRFAERYGPNGLGARLAGLYDAGETGDVSRGLARAGLVGDLESLGFFACVDDLEDELIRALGTDAVERVIDAEGQLGSFRTLQKQPAQRERPLDRQLQRFFGSHGGHKIRYARLLVEALDLDRVPRPLDAVLTYSDIGM